MIVSVKRGDRGKVFDCYGKHLDDSIISCNLETGETVRQILDENGQPQIDPEDPKQSWKETMFYKNLPLRFERD